MSPTHEIKLRAVPEGKYVDVGGGIRFHLHDVGEAQKGTLLFLHGSGPGASGYSNFKGNYPYLNERGYRTLVPDLFGYGYSDKPEEGNFDLEDLAAQMRGLLDALDVGKVSLVGNSMGGAIAIRFALDYPERVEKLVLMAPGGIEAREVYMEMEGIKAMLASLGKPPSRESMLDTFKLQLFDESKITDEILEERLQILKLQPKGLLARLKVNDQQERLSEIAAPVLCLWGVNDKFCPATGAMKIAERCKNSRTMLISECGHWVMVEHPSLFNDLCARFLDGTLG
jgi:4,5:9,10-diseco-3-hydroxy-5,9,17-trioxoandrosta-1(10),2-diene-4-oate hydrolase